jgi:hypothetical protein
MAPKGKHQARALSWINTIKSGAQALVGKKVGRAINSKVLGAVTGESFAKGGPVKKTGLALVHRGETVLTKAQSASLKKVLNKK